MLNVTIFSGMTFLYRASSGFYVHRCDGVKRVGVREGVRGGSEFMGYKIYTDREGYETSPRNTEISTLPTL